jgi:hypothetical protein
MIRALTTEWFWGASHRALKKAARGVASRRIIQAYASFLSNTNLEEK